MDRDVDNETMSELLNHAAECETCWKTLLAVQEEEASFRASLAAGEIQGRKSVGDRATNCPPGSLLLAYTLDALPGDRRSLLETHLMKCPQCQAIAENLAERADAPGDLGLDFSFLDTSDKNAVHEPAILSIVLSIREGFLHLVRHTGDLLSPPGVGFAFRNFEKPEFERETFSIRKDLEEHDRSFQITIDRNVGAGEAEIRLSVMSLSTEAFIPGTELSLVGQGHYESQRTTEEGTVSFRIASKGEYRITEGNRAVIELTIH